MKKAKDCSTSPDVIHEMPGCRHWRSEGEDGSEVGEASVLAFAARER